MPDLPPERLLTRRETADLIGTSERTLKRWGASGEGPPALRFGRKKRMVRYPLAGVRRWLHEAMEAEASAS